MDPFPRAFLLVFAQLAVGGFASLSIPPFRQIDRGYFKSTAFVYLLIGAITFVGKVTLWYRTAPTARTAIDGLELVLWGLFLAAASGYFATLWGEPVRLRARLFAATWISGVIALVVAARSYCPPSSPTVEVLVYSVAFMISSLLLGTVLSGMLLGHWYLIDRNLSLSPFRTMLGFYAGCLAAQVAVLALGTALLLVAGNAATWSGYHQLWESHLPFFAARLAVSPLFAAILAAMIWRTLQIPQTMAATGLFYIAILAVVVGELMGRYLLFRTGLPL